MTIKRHTGIGGVGGAMRKIKILVVCRTITVTANVVAMRVKRNLLN